MNTPKIRFTLFTYLFASSNRRSQRPNVHRLAAEQLEERALLSVSPAEYEDIVATYSDFNLPASQEDINIIEIDSSSLSVENLKSAIATAKTTTESDLIVVRTSETANTITYATSSDGITIDINSTQYGSITIIGWGDENLTLDANQLCRVMSISGTKTVVNLGGMTITGGKSSYNGGGIYINSSGALTVTNSTISGNTASSGGGIYNDSGTLKVTNCTISENMAEYGGGIFNSSSTLAVTNSTISGNTASSGGGGIYNYSGTLTVTNSTISENTASGDYSNGGGIYNFGGAITVTNSTIAGNTASGDYSYGGGIYNKGTLNAYNTIIACNTVTNGNSDIYKFGGTINGYNSLSSYTEWDEGGNNIAYDSTMTLFHSINKGDFRLANGSLAINAGNNNYAVDAAGNPLEFDLAGNARIMYGTVDIGAYEYQGIIVDTLDDVVNAIDSKWSLREALSQTPASGTITFDESLAGGTITLVGGELVVDKSLVIDASALAGGIAINANKKSRVFKITGGTSEALVQLIGLNITGGKTSDNGGGIYNSSGTLKVTNCTISGNTASNNGGGVYNVLGRFKSYNSIIACNTATNGPDIYNENYSTVHGYNSLSSYTAWNEGSNNIVYNSAKPLFRNIVNGDYRLANGSQAIDKGNNDYAVDAAGNPLEFDLAGNARIMYGTVDIGAYEYQGIIVDTLEDVVDADDGKWSLREALSQTPASGTITFDESLAGKTITLSGTELVVDKPLVIDASALAGGIAINADQKSRVFKITGGTSEAPVQLIGLNITGGKFEGFDGTANGGGIYNSSGTITVTNCTISGNMAFYGTGGGIYNTGTLTVTNSTISENTADRGGGGIYNYYDGTLTVTDSTIAGNTAEYGGGIYNDGTLTVTNSTISGNTADISGGGILNISGDLTVTNSTISGNTAASGGGIYNDGTLTVTNSTISGNTAASGGGIYNYSGTTLKSYNSIIACNTATEGNSDIYRFGGTVKGYNSLSSYNAWDEVSNNIAYVPAKPLFRNIVNGDYRLANGSQAIDKGKNDYAVDAAGNPLYFDLAGNERITFDTVDIGAYEYQRIVVNTLEDVVNLDDDNWSLREALSQTPASRTITFDESLAGGTITLSGTELIVDKSLVIDASALTGGITINANKKSRVFKITGGTSEAPVQLIGLNITGGKATNDYGGGIYNDSGKITVTNCTISENMAEFGGGIYNNYDSGGALTVTNSTISGNTASSRGGGIYNFVNGTLTVTNSTISENTASGDDSNGGGIYNHNGKLTVTNSTISGNTASNNGGGIYNNYEGTLKSFNSIIACNTANNGNDIYNNGGTINGYNSLSSYTEWDKGGNNITYNSAKPLFRNIVNGDYRLANGSLAINAGNNDYAVDAAGNPLEFDLAGNERIMFGTVDIGAYEYQGIIVDTLEDVVDADDGKWSLREALSTTPDTWTITFDESLAGGTITLVGGELVVDKPLVIDASALAGGIAINANKKSRVFKITGGTSEAPVQLIGLNITGGNTTNNGGGIYNDSGTIKVTNCTISGNTASNNGGGVYNVLGRFKSYNSIIACNTANNGNDIYKNGGTVKGYNSLSSYTEWDEGGNNIAYDSTMTLFRNIVNGDYRLANGSLAINAGNNDYAVDAAGNPLELDLAGNERIMFGTVDIGAYEYQGIIVDTLEDVVDADDGKWSLREALSQTPASGTITFDESLAGKTITLSGTELVVDKPLVIDASALAGGIAINADQKSRVFKITGGTSEAPVQLIGLNITGGNTTNNGGGIYNYYGALTVTNSTIAENTTDRDGGGIYNISGALTVTNSTIAGNTAEYGGGVYNVLGRFKSYNSIIACNTAYYGNDINKNGGTINGYNSLSSYTAWDEGSNNIAYVPAKPLFLDSENGNYRLAIDSQAINKGKNDYADDAGLTQDSKDNTGMPRITDEIIDIGAYEYQGIIVDTLDDVVDPDDGKWSLRELISITPASRTIAFDESLAGGTITLSGTELIVDKSLVIDASALTGGITINANQKSRVFKITGGTDESPVQLIGLNITGGKFEGFDGTANGGGIYNTGTLTVTNSTISGNTAASYGGGIYNTGTLTVTNSTIAGNTASIRGGGIYNKGTLTVTNSTIAGNTADDGGGIYNNYNGTLTVTNSTIAGNTADDGGGIYNFGGMLNAYNTIIACNTTTNGNYDIYNIIGTVNGYNSLSSYTAWDEGSNNIAYVPAKPLFLDSENGNYRLAIDSQAINKGKNDYADDAGLTQDSKDNTGMPRITDEIIDIGAYEYCIVTPIGLNEEITGNLTAENQYMQVYSFAVDDETTISFSLLQGDWTGLSVKLYRSGYSQDLTSESGEFTLSEAGTYYLQLQPAVESTEQDYTFCVNSHNVEIISVGVANSSTHETTDVIPDGLTELTDWDSFYVEFWSESMPEALANQSATAEMNYDPMLFTLDITQTIVCPAGINAVFSEPKTEDNGTVTVEVTFTVGEEDYTAPGANLYWGCVHFTPTLDEGAGLADIYSEADSFGMKVKAVAYDLERNDKVDMTDFIEFAKLFNQTVEGNENPLVEVADFNGSGTVDMADFILFARNFNKKKTDKNVTIVQPEPTEAAVPVAKPVCESTPVAIPDLSQPRLLSSTRLSRATDAAILDLYESQYESKAIDLILSEMSDERFQLD